MDNATIAEALSLMAQGAAQLAEELRGQVAPPSEDDRHLEWMHKAIEIDGVRRWLSQRCVDLPEGAQGTMACAIFNDYFHWSGHAPRHWPVSKTMFWKLLKSMGVERSRADASGNRYAVALKTSLVEEPPEVEETPSRASVTPRRGGIPVRAIHRWMDERLRDDGTTTYKDGFTTSKELYNDYVNWAANNADGLVDHPRSLAAFGRQLYAAGVEKRRTKRANVGGFKYKVSLIPQVEETPPAKKTWKTRRHSPAGQAFATIVNDLLDATPLDAAKLAMVVGVTRNCVMKWKGGYTVPHQRHWHAFRAVVRAYELHPKMPVTRTTFIANHTTD